MNNLQKKSFFPKPSLLRFLWVSMFGVFVLTTGCTVVGPNYQRSEKATQLPNDFLIAEEANSTETLSSTWWHAINDPLLDELIKKTLSANTDLLEAQAKIREADANLREVGGAILPQVDLATAGTRSRVSQRTASVQPGVSSVRDNLRIALSTSYELDFWGKVYRTRESAQAQLEGARFAKDTLNISLSSLVAQTYLSLRFVDLQIHEAQTIAQTHQETIRLLNLKLKAGNLSESDVRNAQANLSNAQTSVADLVQQRTLLQHQLGILSGELNLQIETREHYPLPNLALPPAGLPSSLLNRRPDILQAETKLIAANAKIGVARAAMFPTITLTGLLGGESKELSSLLGAPARIWSLGFGLNLPIFDGGKLSARLDAAKAQQEQALASYQRAVQNAFRDVNDALATLRQTRYNVEQQNERIQSLQRINQLLTARLAAGQISRLELLENQRIVADAKNNLLRMQLAYTKASIDFIKALGGGWHVDLHDRKK